MKVFEFKDYDHYIEGQRLKQNFQDLWAKPDVIYQIAEYIKNNISNPKFGICHGVRRGEEVEHFLNSFKQLNLPDIDVIGTDICDFDVEEDNGIWDAMNKGLNLAKGGVSRWHGAENQPCLPLLR